MIIRFIWFHLVTRYVNHRIHPGDCLNPHGIPETVKPTRVIAYDRKVINDDRVELSTFAFDGEVDSWTPPAPVSGLNTFGFAHIQHCTAAVFGAPVAPMLMLGNTDTRWYWDLSSNIYRFSPIVLDLEDTKMFHGTDERISTSNLVALYEFYELLVRRTVVEEDLNPA